MFENKWLIVGLGNPLTNQKFVHTRHNIGVKAVEYIAGQVNWQQKFKGLTAAAGNHIYLLPQTYMNVSGASVLAAVAFYKVLPENIIVLHDEIELKVAKLRLKQGGGHGGHNGLKSIDNAIGKNYFRLRIGVDRPPMELTQHNPNMVADYVLQNFPIDEYRLIAQSYPKIDQCIDALIESGLEAGQQVLAI